MTVITSIQSYACLGTGKVPLNAEYLYIVELESYYRPRLVLPSVSVKNPNTLRQKTPTLCFSKQSRKLKDPKVVNESTEPDLGLRVLYLSTCFWDSFGKDAIMKCKFILVCSLSLLVTSTPSDSKVRLRALMSCKPQARAQDPKLRARADRKEP